MKSFKLLILAAALVFCGGLQAAPATAQENKPAFSGTPAGQGGRSAEAQERAREMGQKNGPAAEKAKAEKAKAAKAKADKTKANKKS